MELAAISSYADSTEDVPGETLLKIVKLEEGTETPLEGAVFSVVDPEGRKVGSFSSDENGEVLIPLTLEGHYTVTEISRPGITCSRRRPPSTSMCEYNKTAIVTFTNAPLAPCGWKNRRHRRRPLRRYHPDQAHWGRGDPDGADPQRRGGVR